MITLLKLAKIYLSDRNQEGFVRAIEKLEAKTDLKAYGDLDEININLNEEIKKLKEALNLVKCHPSLDDETWIHETIDEALKL